MTADGQLARMLPSGTICKVMALLLLAIAAAPVGAAWVSSCSAGSVLLSLTPSLLPVGKGTPGSVQLTGCGFNESGNVIVQLSHSQDSRFSALVRGAAAAASEGVSSVTFAAPESWPTGAVDVTVGSSNAVVLLLYALPNITSITPNRSIIAGGEMMTISGEGFFPSHSIVVEVTIPTYTTTRVTAVARAGMIGANVTQTAAGAFAWLAADSDDDDGGGRGTARGVVLFTMPQLPTPLDVDLDALAPGSAANFPATVRVAMNGVDFERGDGGGDGRGSGELLILEARRVFRIGYIYVGRINDFGWNYNWNLARMEVRVWRGEGNGWAVRARK